MSGTPDHTGKTGGGGSSRLSVDAAVFVPGLGSCTGSQANEPLMQVPGYLTTCYPFVSPGSQPRHEAAADDDEAFDLPENFVPDFAGRLDPSAAAAHAIHFAPHLGYEPSTTHAWMSSSMPFGPAMNLGSFTPGVHIPFDGGTLGVGPARGPGLLPSPQKMGMGDGLLPTPPFPPLQGSVLNPVPPFQLHSAMGRGHQELNINSAVFVPSVSRESIPRKAFPASVNKVWDWKVPENPGSISRGTQKEVVNISTSPRRHTIIMKDATVQTDFNLELAELTLQEKPSLLYRHGQRRTNWSLPIHNSTDSEEVDSDSGYSSPMHRRNLVSNGTHPVRIGALVELDHTQSRSAAIEEKRPPVSAVIISVGSCSTSPSTTPLDTPCTTPVVTPTASSTSLASSGGSSHKPQSIVQPFPSPGAVKPGTPRVKSKQREWSKSKDSVNSGDEDQGKVKMATAGEGEAAPVPLPTTVKTDWTAPPVMKDWTMSSVKTDWTAPPNSMEFPTLKPARRNEPPWSLTPVASSRRGDQTGGCLGTVMDSVKSYASIVKSLSSQPPDSAAPVPTQVVQNSNNSCADLEADKLDKGKKGSVVVQHQAAGQSSSSEGAQVRASHVAGAVAGSTGARAGNRVGAGRPDSISAVAPPDKEVSTGVQAPRAMQLPGLRAWRGAVYSKPGILGPAPVPVQLAWGSAGCRYRPPSFPHPAFLQGAPVLTTSVDSLRKPQSVRDEARAHCISSALPAAAGTLLPEASIKFAPSPRADNSGSTPSTAAGKDDSPMRRNRSSSRRSSSGGREHHRSRSKSGNITDTTHPASAASCGEEEEGEGNKTGEGEEGVVVKKRRRRRRRRRRGRTSTEGEGQSDGMSGMERAASSSNISRTSDVTLHFEDDQEFPDIGTACALDSSGGGVLGQREESTLASRLGGEKDIGLGGAVPAGILAFRRSDSTSSLTYSDILRRKPSLTGVRNRTQSAPGSCLSGEEGGEEDFNSQPAGERWAGQTAASSKRAQKRRKRRELANRAAEAELAEITLEQQMLRELGTKVGGQGLRPGSGPREDRAKSRDTVSKLPARGLITDPQVVKQCKATSAAAATGGGGGRRLHTPIALNIADMLDAFEKRKTLDQKAQAPGVVKKLGPKEDRKLANPLDASAPVKRGKEREAPKPKKPSPLKKVILKEREEKKRMRLIGDCEYGGVELPVDTDVEDHTEDFDNNLEGSNTGNPICVGGESDLSQSGLSSRSVDTDQGVSPGADLSPISQTSPMSMSPLTPGASPLNSPIAGFLSRDPVVLRIHSRRFREYCTQILDKEIDTCATALLHELVRFQDRMYHKDPTKAKGKRRVVLGLREVAKHLKLKKIKCVIISPNLEKIQSKGGLDEALNNILNMCQEQNVPFVFALGRRALGRACAKLVPVSVAGIFNYEGCEEKFNDLISLTHKGREAYAEMVRAVEREISENPPPPSLSGATSTSFPSIYAHMGHSRTPSGCSAISFTSSVLSEPISENYPHAEPETDSKGYEIVRDDISDIKASAVQSFCQPCDAEGGLFSISHAATAASSSHNPFPEDSDDGNEADTEDIIDGPLLQQQRSRGLPSKRVASPSKRGSVGEDWKVEAAREEVGSVVVCTLGAGGQPEPAVTVAEDAGNEGKGRSRGLGTEGESVGASAMPHIDSIHCLSYELPSDLLSQHSSSHRTLDLEALSTHSSHTLGDSGGGLGSTHAPDSPPRLGSKDRVQSWLEKNSLAVVDEAQAAEVEERGEDSSSDKGENSSDDLVDEDHLAPSPDKRPGQYSVPKSQSQVLRVTTEESLAYSMSENVMALGNHLHSVPDLTGILEVAAVNNHCLSSDVACLLSGNVSKHSLCVNDHEHACLETSDNVGHARTVDTDVVFVKDLCVVSEDDSSRVNGDFVNMHSFSVLCGEDSELAEVAEMLPELKQSRNTNLQVNQQETSIQRSADS